MLKQPLTKSLVYLGQFSDDFALLRKQKRKLFEIASRALKRFQTTKLHKHVGAGDGLAPSSGKGKMIIHRPESLLNTTERNERQKYQHRIAHILQID